MSQQLVLRPVAPVIAEKSWKRFVHAAEARLKEPRFGLETRDDAYHVRAMLPGVQSVDDVQVTIVDHHLQINAVSRQSFVSSEKAGTTFRYVRERPVNAAFLLPPDADESAFHFELASGVLNITVSRVPCVAVQARDLSDQPKTP